MTLDYAKLKNYAGLKRGSKISELVIDFTKQKYGICFIIAKNKGGKTTLLSALHPLPDNNTCFLDKEEGSKTLKYTLNDKTKIMLKITHPVNSKLERSTTKASFKKLINNEYVELNPNGNIGTYKELVESYFGLDSNFLALSILSTENRGIVSKTPSERKKYVTDILENLEVFNNIGKTMTKRASTLRAMLNSITAKIDSIGNKDMLENNLASYNKKISDLEISKELAIKEQSKHEAFIDTIDPDKTITDQYNILINSLNEIRDEIKLIEDTMYNVIGINDISLIETKLKNGIEHDTNKKIEIEKEMYSLDIIIPRLLAEHEEEAKSIELKTNKLNSLQCKENYIGLSNKINQIKEILVEYEKEFKRMGITNPLNISKDEYLIGYNAIVEIRSSIDSLRSGSVTKDIILTALDKVKTGSNIYNTIDSIKEKIEIAKGEINELNINRISFENKLSKLDILKNRPSECSIDKCAFIANALSIQSEYPLHHLDQIDTEINNLQSKINVYSDNLKEAIMISEYMGYLSIIKRDIDQNKNIILKLPHGHQLVDIDYLVDASINGADFRVMDDVYNAVVDANIFDLYKEYTSNLYKLETDFKLYESKSDIIDEIENDLNKLKNKTNETINRLNELTKAKKDLYIKLDFVNDNLKKYNIVLENLNKLNEKYKLKNDIENHIKEIAEDSEKIKQCIFIVNDIIQRVKRIDIELRPLIKNRDDTIFSLEMLKTYEKELSVYSDKYAKTEIIRKHSIPKTGIQKIFMEMYMHKVIAISNEILSYFFDGDLELLKHVIDDTQFALPCYDKPSGITNADISLCSGSEQCMIGMVISYSLLRQSASDYDVLRLDEIDATLDQSNRLMFLPTLHKFKEILGVEQIIAISHASELELDNADIIMLSQSDKYTGNISGNIICKIE